MAAANAFIIDGAKPFDRSASNGMLRREAEDIAWDLSLSPHTTAEKQAIYLHNML